MYSAFVTNYLDSSTMPPVFNLASWEMTNICFIVHFLSGHRMPERAN